MGASSACTVVDPSRFRDLSEGTLPDIENLMRTLADKEEQRRGVGLGILRTEPGPGLCKLELERLVAVSEVGSLERE